MKNITYINAGAGSGKTYTLTETLSDLIKTDQCSVAEIIMTTFTEKAAADLRLETKKKLLGKNEFQAAAEVENATIGTVHSIAFEYIKRYWYKLGISASVAAIDDTQKNDIIKSLLSTVVTEEDIKAFSAYAETFQLKQPQSTKYNYDFWRGLLGNLIDKATAFDVADINESEQKSLAFAKHFFGSQEHSEMYYDCIKRIFAIYERCYKQYAEYKKRHNVIEFNDMESMFLKLLENDEVKADIKDSIKYVFVDEFQDSNPKQIRIFDRLSELVVHSYWVGDPKQAIYGFRACDTTLVQAVMTYIQNQKELGNSQFEYTNLPKSRRSVRQLVENTNTVFTAVFSGMKDVALTPHRTEELPGSSLIHWDARKPGVDKNGKPKITCNAGDAYNAIAFKVYKMLHEKKDPCKVYEDGKLRSIQPSDIAILTLKNSDANSVAQALRRYGIPVKISTEVGGDNIEIRLVMLLLNYLLHADAELLRAEIAHLYCNLPTEQILNGAVADISAIENLCRQLANLPVSAIVRQLILKLDLLHSCGKWGNADERQQNLIALMNHAEQYDSACAQTGEAASIDSYLSKLEEGFEKSELFSQNGVNVMTYHKSKGLQWPIVILCSLDSSQLSDKGLIKHYTTDVTAMRTVDPTPGNFYSEYYLLCLPPYVSGNTNPADSIIDAVIHDAGFEKYKQLQIEEKQHLMYVGATRARDYMITVSKKGGKLTLLQEIGIKSSISKDVEDSQAIWGEGTIGIPGEIIMPEDKVAIRPDTTYDLLPKNSSAPSCTLKYLQPSKYENAELVKQVSVNLRYPEDIAKASRIDVGTTTQYDTLGTCIHNFMAVYDPDRTADENITTATRIINAFRMADVLPRPEQVVHAAEQLYIWMEQTYGKAKKIEH
jgi:ATP-dependent exoDNAse (exonuclease V) beta subunit